MNIYEILVTVGLTVVAAAVIAYSTFKLQAWHRERVLFKALQGEIEINKIKLENFIMEEDRFQSGKRDYEPEAPILFTESYEALRLSGELLKITESVRDRLNNTMSLIVVHNFRMSEAGLDYFEAKGDSEKKRHRMDTIVKNLKLLEDELTREGEKYTNRICYECRKLLRRMGYVE